MEDVGEAIARIHGRVGALQKQLDILSEAHEALKGQHISLRGRVYALWGKVPGEASTSSVVPAAAGDQVSSGNLADPNLTKDQVRFRLFKEGKLNARFHQGK